MEIALFWLVLCFVVAGLAPSRGRSAIGFFFLSIFLSPLIGLIVLLVLRNLAAEKRESTTLNARHLDGLAAIRSTTGPSQVGVADELRKLAELRAGGVLSEQEFTQQKARLLAGSETNSTSETQKRTCARCGTLVSSTAISCTGCGGKFVQPVANANRPTKS